MTEVSSPVTELTMKGYFFAKASNPPAVNCEYLTRRLGPTFDVFHNDASVMLAQQGAQVFGFRIARARLRSKRNAHNPDRVSNLSHHNKAESAGPADHGALSVRREPVVNLDPACFRFQILACHGQAY